MRKLIENWVQDQVEDCQEAWEFPDDFDTDAAARYLFHNFNYEIIHDHLDSLLSNYLR